MVATFMLTFLVIVWGSCIVANGSGQFPERNFEKLRRSNCSKCTERFPINVAEVLPRLTLIKQRILNALGRSAVNINPRREGSAKTRSPLNEMAKFQIHTTPKPQTRHGYRLNEIVSFSEYADENQSGTVLKFRIHGNSNQGNEEAVGASLLLYVNRRRKMKKGGKGKKIFLEISKLTGGNTTWDPLTYLRTRVKKRRWKRVSLPVAVAQQLLDSKNKSLDLKVRCIGCGRLVQLVFQKQKDTNRIRKHKHSNKKHTRDHVDKRVKRRKKTADGKRGHSSSPILVISTRTRV